MFKAEWAPVAHHVLTTGESFPWTSILSLELKTTIQSYQKDTTIKKLNFSFSAFIIDVFYHEFQYPNLGWNWTLLAPHVSIYYSTLWDTNYTTMLYGICEHFLGSIYPKIFREEAPTFSEESRNLITMMGDWYVCEYFSCIRIWGSNTIHMLPNIVPNKLVIE